MKKPIFLILLMITSFFIFAQSNYTLTRYSFSAAGGAQGSSVYSSFSSFAQFAQGKVSSTNYTGYLGFLFPNPNQSPPVITSVDDVPNDQGLQVQVVWNKCDFDDTYDSDTFYSLWRLDDDFSRIAVSKKQNYSLRTFAKSSFSKNFREKQTNVSSLNSKIANSMEDISDRIFTEPDIIVRKARKNPDKTYYWQTERDVWAFIAEIPALCYSQYSYIAPTLADSSASGYNYSTFKVVFHDEFQYYESVPDSGYSVDNIPPNPTRTSIALNGSNIKLEWEKVEYGTFEGNRYPEKNGIWYKIYASDEPYFDCDASTYLTTVTDLEYNYPISENKKFFKIVVSDKP